MPWVSAIPAANFPQTVLQMETALTSTVFHSHELLRRSVDCCFALVS